MYFKSHGIVLLAKFFCAGLLQVSLWSKHTDFFDELK